MDAGLAGNLGPWGVFVAAITDNLLPVIPVDAVVASYVYRDPSRLWFYVVMATCGAALGSLVWFFIGRAGGELLLLKRINRAKLESLQARYRKQEFFFIAIPCMLPPPTPLKLIILAAGAFDMRLVDVRALHSGGALCAFSRSPSGRPLRAADRRHHHGHGQAARNSAAGSYLRRHYPCSGSGRG